MRAITETEVEILRLLTSLDFTGVEQLREQIDSIRDVEPNCTCGCPSFTPLIDHAKAPPALGGTMLPTELIEEEREDGIPRTVIWFRDEHGYIANVECVYCDDALPEWPIPENCTVMGRAQS